MLCHLITCNFSEAILNNVEFGKIGLAVGGYISLRNAKFINAKFIDTKFNASIKGADFTGATVNGFKVTKELLLSMGITNDSLKDANSVIDGTVKF